MEIRVSDKEWEDIREFINLWLRDPQWYCNNCGKDYKPDEFPCCDNPQVADNKTHTRGLIRQNKELQATRKNIFASTDDKTLRLTVSLPPRLLIDLEGLYRKLYNRKFFDKPETLRTFARRFPMFCVPERI